MEILLLLIPFGIFALAFYLRGGGRYVAPEVSPINPAQLKFFEAVPSLFVNGAEAALFHALNTRLPDQFHVHSKVRLEDIIRVRRDVNPKLRWSLRGRVKSRHVDFLITTRAGQLVLAIELDGASHDPKNPSESDRVKTALFKAAGVNLRRIRVGENFDQIATKITAEIES